MKGKCTSAVCFTCWLADNTALKSEVLSVTVYKLSPWECPSPILPWKLLQPFAQQMSLKAKYKRKNATYLSFIMLQSLLGTQRYLSFWNYLSFLVKVLELRLPLSSVDACSAQWGMKTGSPEEMI